MIKIEPLLNSQINSDIDSDSDVDTEPYIPITQSELAHLQQQQREKQYRQICKVEQNSTNPLTSSINTLQESDMQELLKLIDLYMLRSLALVNANDSVLSVKLKEPLPKSTSLGSGNLGSTLSASMNSFADLRQMTVVPNRTKDDDFTLRIDSMMPMDLLRNGLRAGNPFVPQPVVVTTPKDPVKPTTTKESSTKASATLAGHKLTFKYLLTIDANKNYFEFTSDKLSTNEQLELCKIGVNKKPPSWSHFDYDQISLDVLLNKRKPSGRSKTRYLNSRAIFDRLLQYFSHALKFDFPTRQAASTAMSVQTANGLTKNTSSMSKITNKSKSAEAGPDPNVAPPDPLGETRTCYLKNNQLIINFKLEQGFRTFKNLEVSLIINIGIRFNENHLLNEVISDAIATVVQKLQPPNDARLGNGNMVDINSFTACVRGVFNTDSSFLYLVPAIIHYWTVDLRQTKINLVKYLIYTHTVPYNRRMSDLANLSVEAKTLQGGGNKYGGRFNTSLITSSQVPIFMFFKSLQVFVNQSFITFVLNNNMTDLLTENNSLQYELEELVVNIFIDTLVRLKSDQAKFTAECIFDILWSALVKLRVYLFEKNRVPDPFKVQNSVTPSFVVRLGGCFSLNAVYNCRVINSLEELRASFETSMRTFFKAVVGEDIVPPEEDEEKELIQATEADLAEVEKNLESISNVLSNGNANNLLSNANQVPPPPQVPKAVADVPRLIKNLSKPNVSRLSNLGSTIRINEVS